MQLEEARHVTGGKGRGLGGLMILIKGILGGMGLLVSAAQAPGKLLAARRGLSK